MFERYTIAARRVIFFARSEAGELGSPAIESEHLLLGLLQADRALVNRLFSQPVPPDSIRDRIMGHVRKGKKLALSVDLPLSEECQRILVCAVKEADALSLSFVGTEHLLLALLAEEKCLGAEILQECGLRLADVRPGNPKGEIRGMGGRG
ncbi:MAG: Clp protease N-terminal domain-containing protein [Candidatus Acidiferrales bacterium]|jgi:ATP-dependent Clp protease ATP-binding subunit ClpC